MDNQEELSMDKNLPTEILEEPLPNIKSPIGQAIFLRLAIHATLVTIFVCIIGYLLATT